MTTKGTRLMMSFLLLFVAVSSLAGCLGTASEHPQEGGGPVRVPLGEEFQLRVGQRGAVQDTDFKVKFSSVANDSRCPADVTCVWAGNAEVLIEAEAGGRRGDLKLNTNGGEGFPKEAKHQQYSVALVALSPQPRSDTKTNASDYVATLTIRKE